MTSQHPSTSPSMCPWAGGVGLAAEQVGPSRGVGFWQVKGSNPADRCRSQKQGQQCEMKQVERERWKEKGPKNCSPGPGGKLSHRVGKSRWV